MRRVLVREKSRWSIENFSTKIGVSPARANEYVDTLLERGVMVYSPPKNEIGTFSSGRIPSENVYQFNFVGIAILDEVVLVVLPKYLPVEDATSVNLAQILRAIRKYGGSRSSIAAVSELGARKNDRIALILRLLELYGEYGEYSNYVRVYRANGRGTINWERTISKYQPVFSNETPVYFEYETNESVRDVTDYVTRLHRCVLTECSKSIIELGISDLLAVDSLELSDENLSDFGDLAFVNRKLEQEQAAQFVTWKREVLDLLGRYVNEDEIAVRNWGGFCLGNTAFHEVWEDACQVAFGDQLHCSLDRLGVHLKGDYQNKANQELIDIIAHPEWYRTKDGQEEFCGSSKTLEPDTVVIRRINGQKVFAILDAKYYCPSLEGSPKGVPRLESVTKQFLYQSAYRDFVEVHEFDYVANIFLIPGTGKVSHKMGHVEFGGVIPSLGRPFSDVIDMWSLPAERIWQCYLDSRRLSDEEIADVLVCPHKEESKLHSQVSLFDLL